MHKGGHVCSFLKDFCICVAVNKLQQLVENLLDVVYLFKVRSNKGHLGNQLLLFSPEPPLEIVFKFGFFFFQLLIQFCETLFNVFELLISQSR